MSQKENCLVIDVETCGSMTNPLVYDLGMAAVERATGRIVESYSLVISEVFYGMPELMDTAYYANKLPVYHQGIDAGMWHIVDMWRAWRGIRYLVDKYNIQRLYAYNAAFDRNALNNTIRTLTENEYGCFFPKGLQFCDIWHMACTTVCKEKAYRKFALANGLVSDAGNYRTSAETVYAFITDCPGYVEAHTSLEDVRIEAAILAHILRKKKKLTEKIVHNPWRLAQVDKRISPNQLQLT